MNDKPKLTDVTDDVPRTDDTETVRPTAVEVGPYKQLVQRVGGLDNIQVHTHQGVRHVTVRIDGQVFSATNSDLHTAAEEILSTLEAAEL